jgi:hypothetical protein
LRDAWREYERDYARYFAGAMVYYALVSLIPILLLVLATLGLLLRVSAVAVTAEQQVLQAVEAGFGPETKVAIDELLGRLQAGSIIAMVVSVAQAQAIRQIDHFLESVALDTTDPTEMELRLVRLCHALDHLSSLERDLGRIPPAINGWQPPTSFEVGAHRLAAWLDASSDPNATVDPAVSLAIHEASKRLSEESRTGREQLLDDIALKRTATATARGALDALAWADGALYDAWRLTESLQTTAAYDRSHVVGSPPPDRNVRDALRPDRPGPATRAA